MPTRVQSALATVAVVALAWLSSGILGCSRSDSVVPLEPRPQYVVGIARDLPPYAFVDGEGRPRGLVVDLMRDLADVLEIEVEMRAGHSADLREALASGEVDIVPQMAISDAAERDFLLSLPHTDVTDSLFVRSDQAPAANRLVSRVDEWLRDQRLAVLSNDPTEEYARALGAEHLSTDDSVSGVLRLLAAGDADCALLPSRPGILLARRLGLEELRVLPVEIDGYSRSLSFAVRQDDRDLLERLERGMVIVTERGDYLAIFNRWEQYGGSDDTEIRRAILWLLLPVAALLLISGTWSFALRRTVARRTAELEREATERHRAEEALRTSEEKYRGLFDSSLDAIALFGLDDQLLDANPAFLDLVGQPLVALRRLDPGAYGLSLTAADAEVRDRVRRLGTSEPYEKMLRIGDHRVLPVRVRTWLVRDGEGQPVSYWSLYHDLTQERRDEQERRRLETQLQNTQKLESLGVLAGGIAHDFNNLLTGILGNTALAMRDLPPDTPVAARLRDVERAGRRAADLCREMLAYSGKGRLMVEQLDLSELIDGMRELLQASVAHTATLEIELAADVPPVFADPAQLRQVVLNLVVNASEALEDGAGIVRVRTGLRNCSQVELEKATSGSSLQPGYCAMIEVSDTGSGMSREVLERIYEPFFTTKFTGRGLGLAATHGLVRGHGGVIHAESEVDLGTTMRVLLPTAEALDDSRSEAGDRTTDEPEDPNGLDDADSIQHHSG